MRMAAQCGLRVARPTARRHIDSRSVRAMRRALLAIVGILVVVLILAQVFLPGIAAKRLRSDLSKQGSEVQVKISAFPAIKLLFNRADKVTISVAGLHTDDDTSQQAGGDDLPDLLAQTKAATKLDVQVRVLNDRLLRVQDVRLRKDGDALTANVTLLKSDIDQALPAKLRLTGSDAHGLTVSGSTDAFGENVDADARVEADGDGALVLSPDGDLGIGDLVSVPVFEDDRVAVDAISARSVSAGYLLTLRGHLR